MTLTFPLFSRRHFYLSESACSFITLIIFNSRGRGVTLVTNVRCARAGKASDASIVRSNTAAFCLAPGGLDCPHKIEANTPVTPFHAGGVAPAWPCLSIRAGTSRLLSPSSSSIFIFNPWEVARFLVTMAAFDHLPPPGPPPPPRPRRRRLPPPEPPPNNY